MVVQNIVFCQAALAVAEVCLPTLFLLLVTEENGIQGGGILPGENFAGKISPLRKVAKFSPGEILAYQFHPSPQLQALCFLSRARLLHQLLDCLHQIS